MASIHFGFRECDLVDAAVPFMGDSISDGILATFLKQPGDKVDVDEPVAQVETEKVTIDVASPEAGVIQKFVVNEGDTVEPGTKISVISKSGEGVASPKKTSDETSSQPPATEKKIEKKPESTTWYSTFKNRLTKLIFVAFFTTTNLFVQNKCEAVRMEFVDDNISGPKLNI